MSHLIIKHTHKNWYINFTLLVPVHTSRRSDSPWTRDMTERCIYREHSQPFQPGQLQPLYHPTVPRARPAADRLW